MTTTTQKINCKECGEIKELHFDAMKIIELINAGHCFDCDFWYKLWILRDDPNSVRVNGQHYFIGPECLENIPKDQLGFNGKKFVIKFFNERVLTTNNLNYQGTIDANFHDRLPDNAEFL